MAPVASPLASKLNLWVKTDDSFTTDGKIVICLACNGSIGYSMEPQFEHHVRTYKHAIVFFEEANALNTGAETFDLKK
jgi:hypothetical protein